MGTLSSFVGVATVVGIVGCGSVVSPPEGEGGSSTEGGSSAEGGSSVEVPSNPAECPVGGIDPGTGPLADDCTVLDLSCTYEEEHGCIVTYVCHCANDDVTDGACGSFTYWTAKSAACEPAAVECEDAKDGDICALPDEYCYVPNAGACISEDRVCSEGHAWRVYPYPLKPSCPSTLPTADEACDPCYDAPDCSYAVEAGCGLAVVTAGCSPDSALWEVTEPACDPPEPG